MYPDHMYDGRMAGTTMGGTSWPSCPFCSNRVWEGPQQTSKGQKLRWRTPGPMAWTFLHVSSTSQAEFSHHFAEQDREPQKWLRHFLPGGLRSASPSTTSTSHGWFPSPWNRVSVVEEPAFNFYSILTNLNVNTGSRFSYWKGFKCIWDNLGTWICFSKLKFHRMHRD